MELKKIAVLVSMFFLLSTFFVVTAQPGQAAVEDNLINLSIDGPQEFFINETINYEVEIRGAFTIDGEPIRAQEADNWTLQTESNLEATIEPEESESHTSNIFTVNVTVHEEDEGNLNFRAYCGKDGEVAFNEIEFGINVEKPEKTEITVRNPTDTHIEELEVALFINGELKAVETLTEFEPGEERNVTFEWSKRDLDSGEHTLEVWTGTSDDVSEFNEERLVMSRTFQIEEETSSLIYAGIIIVMVVASLLVFFWYKSRRRRQRRPW
ncbi:MAG: CARDB domain-containing protein [Candidatus Natronoplasma sp.]